MRLLSGGISAEKTSSTSTLLPIPLKSLTNKIAVHALNGQELPTISRTTEDLTLITSGNHSEIISFLILDSPLAPIVLGGTVDLSNVPAEYHDLKEVFNLMLQKFLKTHKANMKKEAEHIFEGKKENDMHLNDVYTELFITVGDIKDVKQEHEILKTDDIKTRKSQDRPIKCIDIFTELRKNNEKKIVLTKGISGIGKTVSVHKFILDWAEGNANQDIDCVFLLPFGEINMIKDKEVNLHKFLLNFYPELKDLEKSKLYREYNLAFIFDGLDESNLLLNFKSENLSSVEEKSSVDVLFTSLVKGKLLPSALIWVTSRPAAANQIPPKYVGLFTEVKGFTDRQKEDYFKKRITDKTRASRIISHIKTSRSLFIMCHIPVFCWITATVLENENNAENIIATLTEMYIHFLLIQLNMKNQKYDEKEERECEKHLELNREIILKLAKLAFEQLKNKNVLFKEDDLKECGIDVNGSSEFTGMIVEIFKKQDGLHEKKVFCFVHRSIQEFLAAVYVFFCYLKKDIQELKFFFEDPQQRARHKLLFFLRKIFKKVQLHDLMKRAIDKAMQSQSGHLDLFLRFLMGISQESSQNLLTGLFTRTKDTTKSIIKISAHIKQLQNESVQEEASVNLFFCLLELKDHSLHDEIQKYLSSDEHPARELSSAMCSVLVYRMLMSDMVFDEFNPKKFTSPAYYTNLVPAVRCCRKALFDGCGLLDRDCEILSSALQSSNSHLTELDLSNNDLMDSGVNLLSAGLKSSQCQLNILRMAGCRLTGQCCESLSLTLQLSNSSLKVLDLSNNDLQDSGLKLLTDGLKNLNILRLVICNLTAQCCESMSSVLKSSNSCLRELDLSNNDLKDSGVELLSAALKISHCQLNILRLSGCMVTEKGCRYLSSAISSNLNSCLRELDLSYNHPGESGVKPLDKLNVDHGGEFRIIAGLHKYACDLTLDPNTANPFLILSEENRKVTLVREKQPYPDHPERFDHHLQVLCTESLSGRCYWEAEWSRDADISVTYKGISRKEDSDDCEFGLNKNSWSLFCSNDAFTVCHNDMFTDTCVPLGSCKRVGVYVDTSAGILSFYDISDTHTLTHLHTFTSTFTESLYAGFRLLSYDSSVSLCQIKKSCEQQKRHHKPTQLKEILSRYIL
ncbi:LOW QUALITY PROTEIN: NACHT, LRR and PYD domains-containing protein 12-like [Megalobrama amblycephala]|uniref:LOW QUALITY PROTEIN: NACHT, LRR and PYD domains-containing protein 12-like n=1 Tax=Megalobrama amblycephala TaxID=75352 RepID=UPI0020146ECC|nr:LOW QUALITY PROTEIN: NACHT, LRR and PYD domains-containing protein 12-like [Megalobrama amblycephala]